MDRFLLSKANLQLLEANEGLRAIVQSHRFVETPAFERSTPIDKDILGRYTDLAGRILNAIFRPIIFIARAMAKLAGQRPGLITEQEQWKSDDKPEGNAGEEEFVNEEAEPIEEVVEEEVNPEEDSSAYYESEESLTSDKYVLSDEVEDDTSMGTGKEELATPELHSQTNDESRSDAEINDLPEQFTAALNTVTASKDDNAVASTLSTIHTITTNALTKGQLDAKYRKVRVSHPRIQKCMKVSGAIDLALSLGFEVNKDFHLVFRGVSGSHIGSFYQPQWHRVALEQLKLQAEELNLRSSPSRSGFDNDDHRKDNLRDDEIRRRAALAAIARQGKAPKPKKKPKAKKNMMQTNGYNAGLGGSDTRTIFYRGGT